MPTPERPQFAIPHTKAPNTDPQYRLANRPTTISGLIRIAGLGVPTGLLTLLLPQRQWAWRLNRRAVPMRMGTVIRLPARRQSGWLRIFSDSTPSGELTG